MISRFIYRILNLTFYFLFFMIVLRKGDEIFSRGGTHMDAVRAMSDKHGEIHARVQSVEGSRQIIASKSNALSVGREAMLRAVEHGK